MPGPGGPQGDPATPPTAHPEVVGFLEVAALAGDPIPLHGVTLGATLAGTPVGGGGGTGVAEVGDLVVAKATDAASPSLSEAAATGIHTPSALVRFTDGTGASYAELQLADVMVRGLATDSSDAAGELVTIDFTSITVVPGPGDTPAPSAPIGTLASPALPVVSPILSVTWAVANTGGEGGGGAGSSQFDDVVVTHALDANAVTLSSTRCSPVPTCPR